MSKRKIRVPPLTRALAYRNKLVVHKFTERWDVTLHEAGALFEETKRLLWLLVAAEARGQQFHLSPPLQILDEMWHQFVLFTEPYTAYCQRVYGRYIHHHPTTYADRARVDAALRRDPEKFVRARHARDVRQYELVEELLGDRTLFTWYVDLPVRYSDRFFKKRAIPKLSGYVPSRELVRMAKQGPARQPRR